MNNKQENTISISVIRRAFADYYATESRCECRANHEHDEAERKIAELLKPGLKDDVMYNFDWSKYRTPELNNKQKGK